MKKKQECIDWQLVAEVELVYRHNIKQSQRPKVCSSRESYELILAVWDKDKIEYVEQFKVLFLNKANKVLGVFEVSSGGLDSTIVDRRILFTAALKANAHAIILTHNHPSGCLTPSSQDIKLTQDLVAAGNIIHIKVLDHIIITQEGYYSFADEGAL